MNLEQFKEKEISLNELNTVKGGTFLCYLSNVTEVVVDQVVDGFIDGISAAMKKD